MADKLTVVCPECGEVIEITNVHAVILSMHQANQCPSLEVLVGDHG